MNNLSLSDAVYGILDDRPPRKKVCVFLDKRQIHNLKLLSVVTRVKMADYVREGIDQVLEKYQDRLLIEE